MAELTEVRCYECAKRIPEGQIVRGDVTVQTGDDVRAWRRESFCPECASTLEAEGKTARVKEAEDAYHLRVGCLGPILVVAVICVIVEFVGWMR